MKNRVIPAAISPEIMMLNTTPYQLSCDNKYTSLSRVAVQTTRLSKQADLMSASLLAFTTKQQTNQNRWQLVLSQQLSNMYALCTWSRSSKRIRVPTRAEHGYRLTEYGLVSSSTRLLNELFDILSK